MCTCMFMTNKEAAQERLYAIATYSDPSQMLPEPTGSHFARVTVEEPTNPETNGTWYAAVRADFHFALVQDEKLAWPFQEPPRSHKALLKPMLHSQVNGFVECLKLHGIRGIKSAQLVRRLKTGGLKVVAKIAV